MKKKILVITAVLALGTAAAIPAMAHGGHGNYANCTNYGTCVNNGVCTRTCGECGGTIIRGICQDCGSDQRLYQNMGQGMGRHMGNGYGCNR